MCRGCRKTASPLPWSSRVEGMVNRRINPVLSSVYQTLMRWQQRAHSSAAKRRMLDEWDWSSASASHCRRAPSQQSLPQAMSMGLPNTNQPYC
ncbi:hypothetical protein KC350_g28 [Hortaea werneckii]|nr:hypothetical protein KC350_g28 [Hortaea werneckii]